MTVRDASGEGRYPLPALAGDHQVENAALAAVCARLVSRLRHRRCGRCRGTPAGALAGQASARPLARSRRGLGVLGRRRPQRGGGARARPRRRGLGGPAPRPRRRHAEHAAAHGNFLRPLAPFARRVAAVPIPGQAASAAPEDISRGGPRPRHRLRDGRRRRRRDRASHGGGGAARPHPGVRLALSGRRRARGRRRPRRLSPRIPHLTPALSSPEGRRGRRGGTAFVPPPPNRATGPDGATAPRA